MNKKFLFSMWIGFTLGNLFYFAFFNDVKQFLTLEIVETLTLLAVWICLKATNRNIVDR